MLDGWQSSVPLGGILSVYLLPSALFPPMATCVGSSRAGASWDLLHEARQHLWQREERPQPPSSLSECAPSVGPHEVRWPACDIGAGPTTAGCRVLPCGRLQVSVGDFLFLEEDPSASPTVLRPDFIYVRPDSIVLLIAQECVPQLCAVRAHGLQLYAAMMAHAGKLSGLHVRAEVWCAEGGSEWRCEAVDVDGTKTVEALLEEWRCAYFSPFVSNMAEMRRDDATADVQPGSDLFLWFLYAVRHASASVRVASHCSGGPVELLPHCTAPLFAVFAAPRALQMGYKARHGGAQLPGVLVAFTNARGAHVHRYDDEALDTICRASHHLGAAIVVYDDVQRESLLDAVRAYASGSRGTESRYAWDAAKEVAGRCHALDPAISSIHAAQTPIDGGGGEGEGAPHIFRFSVHDVLVRRRVECPLTARASSFPGSFLDYVVARVQQDGVDCLEQVTSNLLSLTNSLVNKTYT